ncbi:MAG: hypothetical protein GX256_09290 [Fretibacterium sp.]|nr:hypothetical protein [Fretibacterium sp.]
MKRKRRTLLLLLALFGIILLVRYVMSDINLDVDLLRDSLAKAPGVILEDLELEREVSGDLWKVRLPRVQRSQGEIHVTSLDICRKLADGNAWYFWGDEGVYREEERHARLLQLLGTIETEARVLNLESPELLWKESEAEFFFPQGLTLYDAEFILRTPEASMDEAGVIVLDKGGSIRWTRPLS